MVTGYNYASYVTTLAEMAVVEQGNAVFQDLIPSVIDYAELRICQDVDPLSTVSAQTGFSLTVGSRNLAIGLLASGQPKFITLQDVNVITPVGTSNPQFGKRNPCLPTTKEYLDFVWGSSDNPGVPDKFAMLDQSTILFGPWPDAAYSLELVGTVRPTSLSSTNTTTFISLNLPSLFMMASLIYITAYQRNFGKMVDEPEMAGSYETQYQKLLKSAEVEEARKKFQAGGWTSMSPAVAATPTRG